MSSADSALGDLERLHRLTVQAVERLRAGDLDQLARLEAERRELMSAMSWASLHGNRRAAERLQAIVALDTELRAAAEAVRDSLGERLVKARRNSSAIGAYNQVGRR